MSQTIEIKVPDIGGFHDVPVIEVLVKPGDSIEAEDALIMLESDKAALEVPSPAAGVVKEVRLKVGDKVSAGTLVLLLEVAAAAASPPSSPPAIQTTSQPAPQPSSQPISQPAPQAVPATTATAALPQAVVPAAAVAEAVATNAHASPSVRLFARELGVEVAKVKGSGPKDRILREDVQNYVKSILTAAPSAPSASTGGGGLNLLPWPKVDFAKFGPVETRPLSRIQKISGANLHRNWVMIPHVTQFDEADITDLETFRVTVNKDQSGVKLTLLAFLIKATVAALKKYPDFNASLDGDNLVLKQYLHIGFAADTPHGLVVPVIRDADKKGVMEIARDMAELSKKAREGKLALPEMQGGSFSISSLGGIGGTAFTPIINAPEVAILGVSKSEIKPKWDGQAFVPRLMLPLSLSYDHRVIDGASAARFTAFVAHLLSDMRRTML